MNAHIYKLLRWSEKYTKTDMVYLAKGSFWLTLGKIFTSGSSFILTFVFANWASPETYGTYKFALSVAAILSIFTLPGMQTALTRTVAKGHEGAIHATINTKVRHSFLGVIVALIGSGYYFYNGNVEVSIIFIIIAATLPIFDTFTIYTAYLFGKQKFKIQTKFQIITQTTSTICILAAITAEGGLITLLLSYFLPLSILRAYFYFKTAREVSNVTNDEAQRTLTYGKHLTLASVPGLIATQIDKILMWSLFGPVEVAIYSIACAIPAQIQALLKRVDVLALAKLSNGQATKADLFRKWKVFTYFTIPVAIVYIAIAPIFFSVLLPQYLSAVFYTQILSLTIILTPKTIIRAYLEAHGEQKKLYTFYVTMASVKLILIVVLVPSFGILGAVLSLVISEICSLLFISFLLYRKI